MMIASLEGHYIRGDSGARNQCVVFPVVQILDAIHPSVTAALVVESFVAGIEEEDSKCSFVGSRSPMRESQGAAAYVEGHVERGIGQSPFPQDVVMNFARLGKPRILGLAYWN